MCGVRLVDRVLIDALWDRLSVVLKIEHMKIQSHLRWYGHVMRGDISSQIHEVMEVEITRKRKKGQKVNRGRVGKEGFGTIWFEKIGCVPSKEMAREQIRAKSANSGQPG